MFRDEEMPSTSSGPNRMDEMPLTSPTVREYLFKILIIGELGTGKTSLIKRYVHNYYNQIYRTTLGVDFSFKEFKWDDTTAVRVHLWDIGGEERVRSMTRIFYKDAVGALILFDVTRAGSLDATLKWKDDLNKKVQLPNGNPIPCILLANKCDLEKKGIVNTPSKMNDFVDENGFAGWFETSPKENINIEESINALITMMIINNKLFNAEKILDSDCFALETPAVEEIPQKKCNC